MKKSDANICLISGVFATSVLLASCGDGSGGGISGRWRYRFWRY